MQYDLTTNITSISAKGSAIFGVYDDKNISNLAKHFNNKDVAKFKDMIKKSSFEGNLLSAP